MEMKRRIGFIERGTEFLKLKRDHLAKELTLRALRRSAAASQSKGA